MDCIRMDPLETSLRVSMEAGQLIREPPTLKALRVGYNDRRIHPAVPAGLSPRVNAIPGADCDLQTDG